MMSNHLELCARIRQWIAVNANAKSSGVKPSLDEAAMRAMAKEYCETIGPVVGELNRCVGWAKAELFVEACSICDDFPDLLATAKELSFEGLVSGASASVEIARLLQPYAGAFGTVPIIQQSSIEAMDRAYGELGRTAAMLAIVQNLALARASVQLRIEALRKLFRDNPGSRLWQSEMSRIEGGAFEWIHSQMLKAHDGGDFQTAKKMMDELARKDWGVPVSESIKGACEALWQNLQGREAERRYGELERAIRDASSASDAARLERLEGAWIQVHNETGHSPSRESDLIVEPAFRWLKEDRHRLAREQQFLDAVADVESALSNGASELVVSRCYSRAGTFDREIPSHVVQRVDHFREAIRAKRRRRTQMLVTAIVGVVAFVGAFVAWSVHRGHVRDAVEKLVAQVEADLKEHRLAEAEILLADQPDLAGEVEVAAINAEVMQSRPQWEKEREAFRVWKIDVETASAGDCSQARFDGLRATINALESVLTSDEGNDRDVLVAKARGAVTMTTGKRLASLAPRSNAFSASVAAVLTLDQLPESHRYDPKALATVRDQIAPIIATGQGVISEYSDIGKEHSTSIQTGVERLEKIQTEIVARLKDIADFGSALKALTASYRDLAEFKRKYAAINEDYKAVLAGLGLRSDFLSGVELTIALDASLAWSTLIGSDPERFHFWSMNMPPVPGVQESLRDYLVLNPDADIKSQLQTLVKIGERAFDPQGASAADRAIERMENSGMAQFCVIPLETGGPIFRKRNESVAIATDPWAAGVMWSLADLSKPIGELAAMAPEQSRRFNRRGTGGDSPTATKIRERFGAMKKDNTLLGSRQIVRRLLSQVAVGEYATITPKLEDPLARLWCALELMSIWNDELAIDKTAGLDQAISAKLQEIQSRYGEVVEYDWVAPRTILPEIVRRTRLTALANEALKSIGSLPSKGDEDDTLFAQLEQSLTILEIAGVIAIDPFGHSRSLMEANGSDGRTLYLLDHRKGSQFEFVPFQASDLQRALVESKSPDAPLLVFAHPVESKTKGGRR